MPWRGLDASDGAEGLYNRRLGRGSVRRAPVHAYPDGTPAVFHGPRCLARYRASGAPGAIPNRQAA